MAKVKNYSAVIDEAPDELVDITLRNDSGHRITFFVAGIDPEVYVTLDGNQAHKMRLPIDEHIDVYAKGKDENGKDELLVTTRLEGS